MIELIYDKSGKPSWKNTFPTIESVQEFIDEKNLSYTDLVSNYFGLYKRCYRNKWIAKLSFTRKIKSWKSYDTIEKVQEFINTNKILTPSELESKYSGLYNHCYKKGWLTFLEYSESNNWRHTNLADIQKIIDDNNLSCSDFINEYPGLYNKSKKEKWLKLLKYKSIPLKYELYDTINKIQELIDEEDLNPRSFKDNYPGLYNMCSSNKWLGNIVYKAEKNNQSYMETCFNKLFPVDIYPEIKRDSTELNWLRTDKGLMRPDILINTSKVKLVVELQGRQHFLNETIWYKTEEDFHESINRDLLKYQLLVEHGFSVIYFVDTKHYSNIKKSVPEKFEPGGYIGGTTIMTSWDELVDLINEKLKEIGENVTNL